MKDTPETVAAFLNGHRAAAEKQRELVAARGPQGAQALAECFSALALLQASGKWPGRDPVSERETERVRALWAKVKREYRSGGV